MEETGRYRNFFYLEIFYLDFFLKKYCIYTIQRYRKSERMFDSSVLICMYVYMYMYVYIYIYIYTHTHTHTHTLQRYRKLERMFDSSVLAATEKSEARGREIQILHEQVCV